MSAISENNAAVNKFCEWINGQSKKITLFLGVGFSKAWDENFPTSIDLFEIDRHDWEVMPHLATFIEENYIPRSSYTPKSSNDNKMDFSTFKNLVYQIEMYKKYPDIRPKYIDSGNVYLIEKQLRALIVEKFLSIAPVYFLDGVSRKIKYGTNVVSKKQKNILELFRELLEKMKKNGTASSAPLSIITTNYDYIAEYIFETLDAKFDFQPIDTEYEIKILNKGYRNYHSYRGFSPLLINGVDMSNPRYSHSNYPIEYSNSIFKINGGFEIFEKDDGFALDYRKKHHHEWCMNPPTIMLPSKEQDYSQLYFKMIFPKVVRELRESDTLIIAGYSLPKEDALLNFIVKQFAESSTEIKREDKKIFHITRSYSEDTEGVLNQIFLQHKDFIHFYYKKNEDEDDTEDEGFNAWAKQVLDKFN